MKNLLKKFFISVKGTNIVYIIDYYNIQNEVKKIKYIISFENKKFNF